MITKFEKTWLENETPEKEIMDEIFYQARKITKNMPVDEKVSLWTEERGEIFEIVKRYIVNKKTKTCGVSGDVLDLTQDDTDKIYNSNKACSQSFRSRAGISFELSLAKAFEESGIDFEKQVWLKDKTRLDFLFPSKEVLEDKNIPAEFSSMLESKRTPRERWLESVHLTGKFKNNAYYISLKPLTKNTVERMLENKLKVIQIGSSKYNLEYLINILLDRQNKLKDFLTKEISTTEAAIAQR